MPQVQIKDAYAQVLVPLQPSIEQAVRRLAIERTSQQIVELQLKVQRWQDKYQCSYDLFAYRTATDDAFVDKLNAHPTTQEWEADLISWEFYDLELREWYQRLQVILMA